MQTFLPYPDFVKTADCLDFRRLGKQRVETKTILGVLLNEKQGWKNHSVMRMWRGCEFSLVLYGIEICRGWRRRGYKDSMLPYFKDLFESLNKKEINKNLPIWLGDKAFHSAHRSALLFKNFNYYSKFGWTEVVEINYLWPSSEL